MVVLAPACNCGNPPAAYEKKIGQADVKFDDRNRKWASYDAQKPV